MKNDMVKQTISINGIIMSLLQMFICIFLIITRIVVNLFVLMLWARGKITVPTLPVSFLFT